MAENSKQVKGIIQLTAAGLLWGASFPAIKYGLSIGLDVGWLVLMRFGIAAAAGMFILLAMGGLRKMSEAVFHKELWLIGALNGLAFIFQYHGLLYTTATNASLLININVVFVAGLGVLILKEKLDRTISISIMLAMGGIFLLTTEGNLSRLQGGGMVGDIFEVLAALTWAFYIIDNKRIVDSGRNGMEITAGMMLVTFIISTPYALYRITMSGGITPLTNAVTLEYWGIILYTALGGSLVAYYLYALGVKRVPAVVSAVFLMFEVVSSLAISYFFLEERLGVIGLLGAVIICVAILLVSFETLREKKGKEKILNQPLTANDK